MTRLLFLGLLWVAAIQVRGDLTVVQSIEDLEDGVIRSKEIVSVFAKGDRIRIDQGQALSSIIRNDLKVTYSIMHGSKQYVVLKHGIMEGIESDEPPVPELQVQVTGHSEEISGFPTHQVLVREGAGETTELWIAEGVLDLNLFVKEFRNFIQFGFVQSDALFKRYPELKGVPIRIVESQGKNTRRGTITRLETEVLEDSIFEVPSGYSERKKGEGQE